MIRCVVLATFLLSLVACASSEGSGSAADNESSGSSESCKAAETVAALDDEGQGKLNDMLSEVFAAQTKAEAKKAFDKGWARWSRSADRLIPQLDAAYSDLEDAAPGSLKDDIRTLAKFSMDMFERFKELDSIAQMRRIEQLFREEGAASAGQAALRVDEFTRRECDVVIAD